jgi:ADP-heptose:LPS heptosyltransferase
MNPWSAARNFLAVRLDNAGDVVMLGPALRAVKEAPPKAQLTLLASPAGALAAPLLPSVDEVIVWRSVWQDLGSLPFDPVREAEFIDELRARNFDGALIFTSFSQTPHVAGYACYLAGVPLRAGESKEFGGAVLTTELRGIPDDLHQVERNLRLVESLGFPAADRSLAVAVGDAARDRTRCLLAGSGIDPAARWVLIHPGASAAARRYPVERWAEVARLLGERGLPVLLTGVEKERETVERAAAGAPDSAVLVGETTMEEYAALIEGAALVLCGNTLPMHLADATRTPVLVLFSGTDLESQWAPRSTPSRLLRVETPCHPCHLFSCPIGLPCLDVSPEQVVAEAEGLIRTAPPRTVAGSSNDGKNARPTDDPVSWTSTPGIPSPGSAVPFETVHRIAVIQALGLGDFLCTTPALRALRDRFPGASLTFVGSPWAEEAIRRSPLIDRYLPFPGWPGIAEWPVDDGRLDAFLATARAHDFDLAIQMHGSGVASNGFLGALGARTTLGYRPGEEPDDRLGHSLPWVEDEPEPLRWLSLVALVGAEPAPTRPEFQVLPPDEERATMLLEAFDRRGGPLVALHAGAKDPARRWPAERFSLLARRLVVEQGARIVLTGGPGDRELTVSIVAEVGGNVLDLAGQTDLGTLAALLARCDLLVTNDTGVSHLAAATATPSVVLFGPAHPARWTPLDRARHRAIDAPALLGEINRAAALARLPVESVLAAAVTQLHAFPPGSPRPTWASGGEVRR